MYLHLPSWNHQVCVIIGMHSQLFCQVDTIIFVFKVYGKSKRSITQKFGIRKKMRKTIIADNGYMRTVATDS